MPAAKLNVLQSIVILIDQQRFARDDGFRGLWWILEAIPRPSERNGS